MTRLIHKIEYWLLSEYHAYIITDNSTWRPTWMMIPFWIHLLYMDYISDIMDNKPEDNSLLEFKKNIFTWIENFNFNWNIIMRMGISPYVFLRKFVLNYVIRYNYLIMYNCITCKRWSNVLINRYVNDWLDSDLERKTWISWKLKLDT